MRLTSVTPKNHSSVTLDKQRATGAEEPGSRHIDTPRPPIQRAASFPTVRKAAKFIKQKKLPEDSFQECEWKDSQVEDPHLQKGLYFPGDGQQPFFIAVKRVRGQPHDGLAISVKTGKEIGRLECVDSGQEKQNLKAWMRVQSAAVRMKGGSPIEDSIASLVPSDDSRMEISQDLIDLVEGWIESNDPERELDLSGERAQVLPPIPPTARRIDISDNELAELPDIPAGTISLIARDNNIKRLPDGFLESLFSKSAECRFDFQGNPLEADQIGRICEVTQAPGYSGPQIMFSAPADMVSDDEKDLTDIGKSKLVGYLPNHKLADVAGMEVQLHDKGLKTETFSREKCGITSGALYAYDAERLAIFLNRPQNKHILDKHGVPSTSDGYVQFIATTRVQKFEKRDLYDLIALTFNDPGKEYDDQRVVLADLVAAR